MTASRCKSCDKNSYSEADVYRAAINTSKTLGTSVRTYECPTDSKIFHITTQPKRVGARGERG